MKIGINFGDNDFQITFENVMNALLFAFNEKDKMFRTKTNLVKIVNSLSIGMYLLHQNKFEYSCSSKEIDHIEKYLNISTSDIFLNDQVDDYLKKNDNWCNSEFIFMDTKTEKIQTI